MTVWVSWSHDKRDQGKIKILVSRENLLTAHSSILCSRKIPKNPFVFENEKNVQSFFKAASILTFVFQ
jgi:hypothetical protein